MSDGLKEFERLADAMTRMAHAYVAFALAVGEDHGVSIDIELDNERLDAALQRASAKWAMRQAGAR